MSTLGNSTTPTSGWDAPGSGYAAATSYTMPSGGGTVTAISGYFDATTGGHSGWLCVWDSAGALIVNSGSFSVNAGGLSAGSQDWWTVSGLSTFVAAGSIWIGFYCNSFLVYSSESTLGSNVKSMGTGGPGSFSGSSVSGVGGVGAYITYTPGGASTGVSWVNIGTVVSPNWAQGTVYVNTGTSVSPIWTASSEVDVNTGTSVSPIWTPAV